MNAKKIGRPSKHKDKRKPTKPRSESIISGWHDNPFALVALCVIVVALVAVVRLQFFANERDADALAEKDAHAADSVASANPPAPRGSSNPFASYESTFAAAPDAGSLTQRKSSSADPDLAAVSRTPSLEDSATAQSDLEPPLDARLPISGRVLDQEGSAVPDMPLVATATQLYGVDAEQPIAESKRTHRTMTGVDGIYSFPSLADGEYTIRTVPVGGQYTRAQISVPAGAVADLVVKALFDVEVRGLITSTTGESLEGARVAATTSGLGSGAATGPDGRFTLHATLKQDPRGFSLRAQREGYRDRVVPVDGFDLGTDAPIELDIVMEPAELAPVAGTVTDADAVPVAGEAVQLHSQGLQRSYEATTDAGGGFVIEGVESGADYRLLVRAGAPYQDYVRRNIRVATDGLKLAVVLEAGGVGTLSGQMVDLNGDPVAGRGVTLRSRTAAQRPLRVTGDAWGYFVAHGVPAGELDLRSPGLQVSAIELASGAEQHVQLVFDVGAGTQ